MQAGRQAQHELTPCRCLLYCLQVFVAKKGCMWWHTHAQTMRDVMGVLARSFAYSPSLQSNMRVCANSSTLAFQVCSTRADPLPRNRPIHNVTMGPLSWLVGDGVAFGKGYVEDGLYHILAHQVPQHKDDLATLMMSFRPANPDDAVRPAQPDKPDEHWKARLARVAAAAKEPTKADLECISEEVATFLGDVLQKQVGGSTLYIAGSPLRSVWHSYTLYIGNT